MRLSAVASALTVGLVRYSGCSCRGFVRVWGAFLACGTFLAVFDIGTNLKAKKQHRAVIIGFVLSEKYHNGVILIV